tara:strand:- start:1012 stop:1647 length:636 start_codon:yes stop_codon:yes gene_type:complete
MNYTEDKRRLKDMLRNYSYRKGEFKLSSGRASEHYINCKPVILKGDGLSLVSKMLLEEVSIACNCVAGLTLGADPLVSGVVMESNRFWNESAMRFGVSGGLIIRKEPKGHGTGAWIEGPLPPHGSIITILEDVITTAKSAIFAAEKVRDAGYYVNDIICIVDRQEEGEADQACKDANITLKSLLKLDEIVPMFERSYRGQGEEHMSLNMAK